MKNFCALSIAATFATILCGTAHASVISGAGSTAIIPAPPSVLLGAIESDTQAWAFDEVQGFVLASDVSVDISTVGLFDSNADLTPGVIPAGTRVSSHLLRSDPIGGNSAIFEGTATFDGIIVGIIVGRTLLDLSDAQLGNPLTTYGDYSARGLELGANTDIVRLEVGRFTVRYRFVTSTSTDDIRVITVIPAAPTTALLGLSGLVALRRRR